MSITVSEGSDPESLPNPPPDWRRVPFSVECARCGFDLRGQSESQCPRCSLTFDWADAVPLERLTCGRCGYCLYGLQDGRCPECGTPFTWEEALARYHRGRNPLFEYRWRAEPVRSFFRTLWRSQRPGRFWRGINLHDPPRVGPLLVMPLVSLLIFGSLFVVGGSVLVWLGEQISVRQTSWRRTLPWKDIFSMIGEVLRQPELYVFMGILLIWCALGLAALLLFQQSMRLARVRFAQVTRVWAHAVAVKPIVFLLYAFLSVTLIYLLLLAISTYVGPNVRLFTLFRWTEHCTLLLALLFWLHGVWSLRQGYAQYLRMPHALAVAVTSQMIALLATLIVVVRTVLANR